MGYVTSQAHRFKRARVIRVVRSNVACVSRVSSRVRRESWDKSFFKKKFGMTGEWRGIHLFFLCSRSNFRAITPLETLATQARSKKSLFIITVNKNFKLAKRTSNRWSKGAASVYHILTVLLRKIDL